MKMFVKASPLRSRRNASGELAFTMVEIAISLAVIGFALVAIIGVLPTGLEVQKENREETIINHDAIYFMSAIRSGSRGVDDLTNYVIRIQNSWADYDAKTNQIRSGVDEYDQFGSTTTPSYPINQGHRIIGLLSTPKYVPGILPPFRSNHVVAYVRSLSGPASDKVPQSDTNIQNLAFSYRMITEVVTPPTYDFHSPYGQNLLTNLNEVRLLFRWPLFANGKTGNGRQVYRSMVAGGLFPTNENRTDPVETRLYFFAPTTFVSTNR